MDLKTFSLTLSSSLEPTFLARGCCWSCPGRAGVGEGLGAVAAASTLWRLPSAGAAGFILLLLRCHLWELPHKIVSLATK